MQLCVEEEEHVTLFTKCGILNVSQKEREPIFTSILEKNGLDFDTFSNTEMLQKLPVTFKYDLSRLELPF